MGEITAQAENVLMSDLWICFRVLPERKGEAFLDRT